EWRSAGFRGGAVAAVRGARSSRRTRRTEALAAAACSATHGSEVAKPSHDPSFVYAPASPPVRFFCDRPGLDHANLCRSSPSFNARYGSLLHTGLDPSLGDLHEPRAGNARRFASHV